jgi:hypothetical protein
MFSAVGMKIVYTLMTIDIDGGELIKERVTFKFTQFK